MRTHTEWQDRIGSSGKKYIHEAVDITIAKGPLYCPATSLRLVYKRTQTNKQGKIFGAGHYALWEVVGSSTRTQFRVFHLDAQPSDPVGTLYKFGDVIATSGCSGHTEPPGHEHVHLETFQFGNRVKPSSIFQMQS